MVSLFIEMCYNYIMNRRIYRLIIIVLLFGMAMQTNFFALGQGTVDDNAEIKDLNKKIQERRDQLATIQKQQAAYSKSIKNKQQEQASLGNQLAILDNRIAKAELDIETVDINIDRTDLEISKVNLEIKVKTDQIEGEKEHIANVLRLMYKQDNKPDVEVLLLNNSFSEFVDQVKYLEQINKEVANSLDGLRILKIDLEKENVSLLDQKKKLQDLQKDLESKRVTLAEESSNKLFILEQTKNSEKEYQKLLQEAKEEQIQSSAEILDLERSVRERIARLNGSALQFNDTGLIWPVTKNVITASFHDPDYPFRYLFEHPGIDIRAAQGSLLRAAASGYIARAKDGGKGYSYIMIIHGDGLATVYGHVSRIDVKEDEYVVQGQVVGLSGGLPGTLGAGGLTTGAHLHFEVRLNGIPVDPMNYLP
jgi:murein DD-endopeptidase MepM/ murein hydrolase activator NlpD